MEIKRDEVTQQIKVRFDSIGKSEDGTLSIIYIPDQKQILEPGKKYQIIIEGLTFEVNKSEKQAEGGSYGSKE